VGRHDQRAPGHRQSVLTLTQNGTTFSGTMASEMGTAEVANGAIDGRRVSWAITIQAAEIRYRISYLYKTQAKYDGTQRREEQRRQR